MKKLLTMMRVLALPVLFMASIAGAEPALTAPDGTQPATPAVPGGGNPEANSDNAATPAVPASPIVREDMPGPDDMEPAEAGKFAEGNPGLRDEAKAKWNAMTPEERQQFGKDNPKIRRAMLRKKWDRMTPAERGAFCDANPEMREKVRTRWGAMTPEERQAFLANHPKIEKRWQKRQAKGMEKRVEKREQRRDGGENGEKMERADGPDGEKKSGMEKKGNKGVRDHGQGLGRDGAGQGKGKGAGHGRK